MKLLIALLVVFSSANPVHAATILVFGQTTGSNLFTGDETAGVTTLSANGIPVTITTLDETGVNISAQFYLSATSTAAAQNVSGNLWTQEYSGDFQINDGVTSYLSGVFAGVQLGIDGGNTLIFGSAEPPLTLSFLSDIAGMPLDSPTAMALSLTNVFPSVSISNGSFADFNSNISGTFSAEAAPIPEPTSMILLGTGLLYVVRKRQLVRRKECQD